MPRLVGNFEHEAIGEAKRWPRVETVQGSDNDLRFLEREIPVIQEHFNGGGNRRWPQVVDRRQERVACVWHRYSQYIPPKPFCSSFGCASGLTTIGKGWSPTGA